MYLQFVKCRDAERIFARGALYIKSKALLYGFENRVEPEAFLGSTVSLSVKCLMPCPSMGSNYFRHLI